MPEEPAPALPTEPAAPAKPDSEVEDLFKDTTPPARPEPAPPADKPKGDDVEDLFKESGDKPTAAIESAPLEPAAEPAAPREQGAQTTSPNAMRLWTDNTGRYHVNARLVMVSQTHVRLFKENGKYTTVPFTRLSQADLAFVREQWTGGIASW